ncbi:Rxt3-domain-containing protein [Sporormia fimetaria CBS 119925]|uniref:Rxt3-domain-containing protein n=1 Tax=Sporormia fimetaria CBS 119925 TaxID=1340428 RepID=A0A6A6V5P0_9PLEO|nr:Rxt3-domain-containing protein [Sporormia fimetaria CBS 119925]
MQHGATQVRVRAPALSLIHTRTHARKRADFLGTAWHGETHWRGRLASRPGSPCPAAPVCANARSDLSQCATDAAKGAPGVSGPPQHHSQHHTPTSQPPPPPPPPSQQQPTHPQPPHPSMSQTHGPPSQPPYPYDHTRRQSHGSHGGASPAHPYGRAPSHDPPPPPPPFNHRAHMPPPSSPQQQHGHPPQSQRSSYPSTYGAARELPAMAPGHRPGSSMSISSIIGGGETTAPNQPTQSRSSPPGGPTNAPGHPHHSMQPPSPRRAFPSENRPDGHGFRRQPSPDRHMYPRPSDGQGYQAPSPTRAYHTHGSPHQPRQPPHHNPQPYRPVAAPNAGPHGAAPSDAQVREQRQPPLSVPARPSSQPQRHPGRPEELEMNPAHDAFELRRPGFGPIDERRRTLGEAHSRPSVADILGPGQPPALEQNRPVTVQPVTHSAYSPPRASRNSSGSVQLPKNIWRHSGIEDNQRDSTEPRREGSPTGYRPYGGYPTPHQPTPYNHPVPEEMVRGRSLDHLSNRVVEQYHAPPTSDPNSTDRLKSEQLSRSYSSGGMAYGGRNPYDVSRRMGDEMHNRPLFALGPEANRKTGRASPLPQAVQGAQAQPVSIGKDPSIKSEFGRMFSGLGSGLGSATPTRQSPMPQGGPETIAPDLPEHRLQRVNSQNGRKNKRVKDEDAMHEGEGADGRGTPSMRGSKRNKHNHPGHHHHHHVHTHQSVHGVASSLPYSGANMISHHHHHHRPDEDVPAHLVQAGPPPFNNPRTGTPSHHHHHHHGAPHHHHHTPICANPSTRMPSPKLPPKIHDIQAVLEKAAQYPRSHLGSYLYEAATELPKPASQLDDQFCYASKPKPLPTFGRNPINCTVTCRVPRYYLKPRQRQQIVVQRHLWGAEIYRDDSDPVAAAIHAGWIRGEWDESVDVGMLDPRITAPNDPSDAEDVLTKRPAAPVKPPADMEAHIDLLILPRLERYDSTVEYGISSRKSAAHDGLSFKIQQIRWVEEGPGSRGQERTAAAMKRRLDASRALLSLTAGGSDVRRAVNGATKIHA